MAASRIVITIDNNLLKRVDLLVKSKRFPNRSKVIQEAVAEKLASMLSPSGILGKMPSPLTPLPEQYFIQWYKPGEGLGVRAF